MREKPEQFKKFSEHHPEVHDAYEKMGTAVHKDGPLDEKTRALIKLGMAAAARFEGAVHSHTRKALDLGITKEEIRHAVLLSLPTLGMPSMMAAMTWVNDILDKE